MFAQKVQVFLQNPKDTVLGTLKKLFRKETGLSCLVCTWHHEGKGTAIVFVKFQIFEFYIISQNIPIQLQADKNSRHFTWRSMYTGHQVSRVFCATLYLWTLATIVFMTKADCALCKACVEAKETIKHQASLIADYQLYICC